MLTYIGASSLLGGLLIPFVVAHRVKFPLKLLLSLILILALYFLAWPSLRLEQLPRLLDLLQLGHDLRVAVDIFAWGLR